MAIPLSAFIRSGDTGINEAFTLLASYASSRTNVTIEIDGDYTLTAQRAFTSINGLKFVGGGSITLDTSGLSSVAYMWRITGSNIEFDGPTIKVEGEDFASRGVALDLQVTEGVRGRFHLIDVSAGAATVTYFMAAVRPSSGTATQTGAIEGVDITSITVEDQRSGGMAFRSILNANLGNIIAINPQQTSTGEDAAVKVLASDRVNIGDIIADEGAGTFESTVVKVGPGGLDSVADLQDSGRLATLDNGTSGDSNLCADAGTGSTVDVTYTAGPSSGAGWIASDFALYTTGDFKTGELQIDSVNLTTKTVTLSKVAGGNFANESFYWYAINTPRFSEYVNVKSVTAIGGSSGAAFFVWGWRYINVGKVSGSTLADYVAGGEWVEYMNIEIGHVEEGPSPGYPSIGLYHFINHCHVYGGVVGTNGRIFSGFGAAPFLNVKVSRVKFVGANAAFIRYIANVCENWQENTWLDSCEFHDEAYCSFESRLGETPGLLVKNVRVTNCKSFNNDSVSPIQFYGVDGLKVRDFEVVSGSAAACKHRNGTGRSDSSNVSLQVDTSGTVLTEEVSQLGDVSVPAVPTP